MATDDDQQRGQEDGRRMPANGAEDQDQRQDPAQEDLAAPEHQGVDAALEQDEALELPLLGEIQVGQVQDRGEIEGRGDEDGQ